MSQNPVFLFPEFLVILKVVVSHRPDFCSPTDVCLTCLYFLLLKLGAFTKSVGLNASQVSWFPSAFFFKCSLDGVAWRLSPACSMALCHLQLLWGNEKEQFGQYAQEALKRRTWSRDLANLVIKQYALPRSLYLVMIGWIWKGIKRKEVFAQQQCYFNVSGLRLLLKSFFSTC